MAKKIVASAQQTKEISALPASPQVAMLDEQYARKLDETIPGGCYLVDGKLVDANGEEIEEEISVEPDASAT